MLYDPSYFGKIITNLQILKGGCKLLTSAVYIISESASFMGSQTDSETLTFQSILNDDEVTKPRLLKSHDFGSLIRALN